jgi:hypothetical protein
MKVIDYQDADGVPHRVALPDGRDDIPPAEGLPVSLNLDMLYTELEPEFRRNFYIALWNMGLIQPCDYLRPGASELFRRAFNSAIRTEFFRVMALAKEVCDTNAKKV